MPQTNTPSRERLDLLSRLYPSRSAAFTEIINLRAILNLPKGTEHFISDVHGEYEAFCHILNNCSGVIREKIDILFESMDSKEKDDLCTLIYYPREILRKFKEEGRSTSDWFRTNLEHLVGLAKYLSSKYTRSKVRKALPRDYNYIIDELMHAQAGEDNNRQMYHSKIIEAIIDTGSAHHFVTSLCFLIKRLAVDHLHLVGDIFDRGAQPDRILDLLMNYHSLDIEWGNHDILWMGAACGSEACIATAVRNNVTYGNYKLLENGYGISMRSLALFAHKFYKFEERSHRIDKAISVLVLKLQGHVIRRHPEWGMNARLLLNFVDYEKGTVHLGDKVYELNTRDFPTIDPSDPYRLIPEEQALIDELKFDFLHSVRLQRHIDFLYQKGAMYKAYNGNLLYHGCLPLNEDGTFAVIECQGERLGGRAYLDYLDKIARNAWFYKRQEDLDYMWWMWCGARSPLSGRVIKTFERAFVSDKSAWEEPRDPYYDLYYRADICEMILAEFGLDPSQGHIINGHTPIKVKQGEKPVRAGGRLLVIDGGFSEHYHKTTGIAGYTLIYNSHGLRLKSHLPFKGIEDALVHNSDIHSSSEMVEIFDKRRMVADVDDGCEIRQEIAELMDLLQAYRSYAIPERSAPPPALKI
ncbi:MAG: fructose-1,6-bisphosphatase [Succinivibrionaceae bacterium]|nr:fructose-1,6-bisphosphatase [Succinivibrionaceae bacterium]